MSRFNLQRTLLYSLIAGASLARIFAAFHHDPMDMLVSDPGRHWAHATDVLATDPMSAVDPIGYQLWLTAVAKLTLGDRTAMAIYAALLSLLTPWIWYRFSRELLATKDAALVAWAVVAWLPSWIGEFSYLMTETLSMPLLGLALWMIWRALRKRDTASLFVALLASLAAMLVRMTALPFVGLGMLAVWWLDPRRWRSAALVAVTVVAVLLPPAYRAYKILHVWAPFGYPAMHTIYYRSKAQTMHMRLITRGLLFTYEFASPNTVQEPFAPLSHWHTSRGRDVYFRIDLDRGTADWDDTLRLWHNSVGDWAQLWKENAIFLLFSESWPDNDDDFFWDRWTVRLRWMWAFLIPVVLAGDLWWLAQHKPPRLFAAMVSLTVLGMVFQTTAAVEGRFRKPFEAAFLINAIWLAEQVRSTQKRSPDP